MISTFGTFLLICLLPAHCSVLFTTIHLADSSTFSTKAFSSLVLTVTNASSLTLHAVEPDTITGAQGKRLFAAPSQFYSFQLLHVTRVRSSIEAEDERTAAVIIRYSLPHEALLRGMGVMGVDSVDLGEADTGWARWLTTAYLELPPFVAQYLILGWALTVLGFLTCITCYCCCCMGPQKAIRVVQRAVVPIAIVTPGTSLTHGNPGKTSPPGAAPTAVAQDRERKTAAVNAKPSAASPAVASPVQPKPAPLPSVSQAESQHVPISQIRELLKRKQLNRGPP